MAWTGGWCEHCAAFGIATPQRPRGRIPLCHDHFAERERVRYSNNKLPYEQRINVDQMVPNPPPRLVSLIPVDKDTSERLVQTATHLASQGSWLDRSLRRRAGDTKTATNVRHRAAELIGVANAVRTVADNASTRIGDLVLEAPTDQIGTVWLARSTVRELSNTVDDLRRAAAKLGPLAEQRESFVSAAEGMITTLEQIRSFKHDRRGMRFTVRRKRDREALGDFIILD